MWILRTLDDAGGDPLTFRLMPGSVKTIGRSVGADFIVSTAMVSRVHCRLTSTPAGDLQVEDLASTNGTFVNDRRVERAVLVPGDHLRVGRLELIVAREAAGRQDK